MLQEAYAVIAKFSNRTVSQRHSQRERALSIGLPWLDELGDGEQSSQQDAQATNHDIGDAQERISATHYSSSRDQDRFGPVVKGYGEVFAWWR